MSRFTTGRAFAFGAFMFLLAAHPMSAQQKPEWTWKDSQGKNRTRAELDRILKEHRVWVDSNSTSGTRAELSGAELSGADLSYAHLEVANLNNANLAKADLMLAHLEYADLNNAHLDGAVLLVAHLRYAGLKNTHLKDAVLWSANLERVIFEPESLPEARGIASAENLELLSYVKNPDALVQLRKLFQDGGFREQERKITYALKRKEAELSWDGCKSHCASFLLNRVFFDWKTDDETRAILWSSDSTSRTGK